jgi:hypothetical protein
MMMKLSRLQSPLAAMYTLLHVFVLRLAHLSVYLFLFVDSHGILQVGAYNSVANIQRYSHAIPSHETLLSYTPFSIALYVLTF